MGRPKTLRCICCHAWRPHSEFYEAPRYRSKRSPYCVTCHNNHSRGRLPCSHQRPSRTDTKPKDTADCGAPACGVCHTALVLGTNLNGVLIESCRCGERPVRLKRPAGFKRYGASEERLKWLASAVERQCREVA